MNVEQIVISFSFIHCIVSITIYYLEMQVYKIATEGLLLVLIIQYFVSKKYEKVHKIISTLLSLTLLIVALQQKYSGQIVLHIIGWIIVTRKSLKIHLLNRLLHVIIVIFGSIFQIVLSWNEQTYLAIIHMQVLISFLCCYCYYEFHKKVNQQANNEMVQMQSSQKVISEDFHRFLTTRRSMNTICSDFVVLDVIPHGVVILTCRQEFQHINEKAIEQLFGLTGIKPNEDNVTDLINFVLKGMLSNMNSPKNKQPENQVSKLISSVMSIQDRNDNAYSPLEVLINNQKGSSIMSSKLITSYQVSGKTRSVKFQIQKQEIPNIIIILILDVTQKVERRNQEQKYKFQHQLLNSFSHELRTPLNCSQQILENLITKCEDEYLLNSLYQILHQNDLLLCQINDILDYASMETGNFHISHSIFTIESLFNQCKEMYEQGCKMKNINLNFKYDIYAPIRNDYMRIKQVLVNLINNSIKFCSFNGSIRIQAKQKIKNEKKLIKIKVKDDGVGITQQKLAIINHVLEQNNDYFDISTSMCIGLGLKVSNKQVKSFISGFNRLKIRSTQNQKTTVSFFIEDQIDDLDLDCQSRTSKTLYGNLSTMTNSEYKFISALKCSCSKILIVDDIPFNHQAIQIMLSGFHSNCDHAFDGLEALQLVTKRVSQNKCHPYYQVILMDIDMPKMNGFDSAIQIREVLQKNSEQTRIIICSAYDNLESRKMAKQCMIEAYLPKPVQKANLLNILSQYVK